MAGYKAAELLNRMMSGERALENLLIPPKPLVIERLSTAMVAIPHEGVAKALGFIQTHYQDVLSVNDVVSASGMSRRGLHKAFQQILNRPIWREVERQRLDHARRLLVETDQKISGIARDAGFGDPRNMYVIFRKRLKMTPTEFRRGQ